MTQPVKNICSPSNIYGGFNHTLFMGCSVMSFSASVGWNEQISEVTVQLVEDPCVAPVASPKHYWDEDLNAQTTTAVDPGFIGTKEMIGAPMYFRVADFEFSGLLQDYEAHSSSSGRPVYTVKIVSPQLILEGVQLIVGEYSGATSVVTNLYNPFGFMESFGIACPLTTFAGATFGTLAGGYGGSGRNNNGMAWNQISRGFNILCNSFGGTIGGNWGGGLVQYRGYSYANTAAVGGYGLMPGYHYYVDISELPIPPSYYRLQGPSVGLLESISQLCEESGYDYYVELLPVQDATLDPTTGVAKFIKFRTVSRVVAPTVGAIASFIDGESTKLQGAASDGLIDSAAGFELRNEVTSTFYFGGNQETIYQNTGSNDPNCDQDDIVLPYWGLDSNKNFIVSCKDDDGWWEFNIETEALNYQLQVLTMPSTVTINEKELLFAAAGFDEWESYEMLAAEQEDAGEAGVGHDIGKALFDQISAFNGGVHNFKGVLAFMAGKGASVAARDFINTRKSAVDTATADDEGKMCTDIDKIYEWLHTFATDFYGKKYAVRVPYSCAQVDGESTLVTNSEVPQSEGWTDESDILGLPTSSPYMQFFRSEDGKYNSFCSMTIGDKIMNWSNLSENNYIVYDSVLYMKSSVEGDDWIYGDYSNRLYPRAVVVLEQAIKFPSFEDLDAGNEIPEGVRGLTWLLDKLAGLASSIPNWHSLPGVVTMNVVLPYKVNDPDGISFGVKSNIHVYGPWGNAGPAGKVRVVHESGLTPWEYGGSAAMNVAGLALSAEGVTNMQYGEKGSANVPGYPEIPLGAELGAYAGGFFGAGTQLIENRASTSDSYTGDHVSDGSTTYNWGYFSYGGSWTGLYGPNVTGISVSVGTGGTNTSYSFSTFTPKFGRFSQYNAERLKAVGRGKLRTQKQFAALFLKQIRMSVRAGQKTDRRRRVFGAKKQAPATPMEVFVGQILPLDKNGVALSRTINTAESMVDASVTISRDKYDETALMSLDGLIRPVSMDGGGSLPRYGNYIRNCDDYQSQGTTPPIHKGDAECADKGGPYYGGDDKHYNQIHQDYLNPFSNPDGFSRCSVVRDKSTSDTTIGHDVDIVGRGSSPPSDGLSMPTWAGFDGTNHADYHNDYRVFAWKGPILIQQWGYDLDGKPMPNFADDAEDASNGTFTTTALRGKFLDGWMSKPHTWPVGPLDLRWDRQRGVWTSPPERRRLLVELCEDLCSGKTVKAKVDTSRSPDFYDEEGDEISTPIVDVVELHNNCYKSGEKLTVYYDPYKCDYRVLEGHAPQVMNSTDWINSAVGIGTTEGIPFNLLKFGDGLTARTGEDCCTVEIGAGMEISTYDTCLAPAAMATVDWVTKMNLGLGLMGNDDGDGEVTVQAGVHFECASGAATGCSAVADNYISTIQIDENSLYAESVDECTIKLSVKAEDSYPQAILWGGETTEVDTLAFSDDFTLSVEIIGSNKIGRLSFATPEGRYDALASDDADKMVGKVVSFVSRLHKKGNELIPVMGYMEFDEEGHLLKVRK